MKDRSTLARLLSSARESILIVERQAIHTANLPSQKTLDSLLGELESAIAEAKQAQEELESIIDHKYYEYENWPACEVCGKPFQNIVNDTYRYPNKAGVMIVRPTEDSPHYFCEEHNRRPKTYSY